MSLIDRLLGSAAPVAQQQSNWIQDLVRSRYQPQQGQVKRTPVGFNFTREPFDPSSYYRSLNQSREFSTLATATTQQEAVNREAAIQAAEQKARQDAINKALQGINPKITYTTIPGIDPNTSVGGPTSGGGMGYPVQKKGLHNYGLKRVSQNVSNAANYFGSRYGITDIGGYGPGSVPGSDHPKGLGLDYMTYKDMKKGTALANDIIKNYKQWNVKYVIWNHYIWNPRQGWHRYHGPRPHTDHVHVSFNR